MTRWGDGNPDGEPIAANQAGKPVGGPVAVIDESTPAAGAGVYYVLAAAVVLDAEAARERLARVTAGRRRPFHYRREGADVRERMVTAIQDLGVQASVLWQSVGRRGQVAARQQTLATHARRMAELRISHLIIESVNEASDGRDRRALIDAFGGRARVPFQYDWRGKSEPLLWIADAVCGIAADVLLGRSDVVGRRLVESGAIELDWVN